MLQADPAVVAQLQSCTDVAATVIAMAAAVIGIDVSAPDVLAHFGEATARQLAVSDAELEQIAGGAEGQTNTVALCVPTINTINIVGCTKPLPPEGTPDRLTHRFDLLGFLGSDGSSGPINVPGPPGPAAASQSSSSSLKA